MDFIIIIDNEVVANGLSYGEFTQWLNDYFVNNDDFRNAFFKALGLNSDSETFTLLDSVDWDDIEELEIPLEGKIFKVEREY